MKPMKMGDHSMNDSFIFMWQNNQLAIISRGTYSKLFFLSNGGTEADTCAHQFVE